MLAIACAIHWEAAPFIEALRLQQDLSIKAFPLFRSEEAELVVTGIGKVRSAAGVAFLLGQAENAAERTVINLGVCGSAAEQDIGSAFLINRISDQATGRSYFPDLLLKSPFPERTLETADVPVTTPEMLCDPDALADMEASGFFEAAIRFVHADQIAVIKVVSDALQCGRLNQQVVASLFAPHLDAILQHAQLHQAHIENRRIDPLSEEDHRELQETVDLLRLTFMQRNELLQAARQYTTRGETGLHEILRMHREAPATKSGRRERFGTLCRHLNSSEAILPAS